MVSLEPVKNETTVMATAQPNLKKNKKDYSSIEMKQIVAYISDAADSVYKFFAFSQIKSDFNSIFEKNTAGVNNLKICLYLTLLVAVVFFMIKMKSKAFINLIAPHYVSL